MHRLRLFITIGVINLAYLPIQGQVITVPDTLSFANMVLYIKPEAKEEIQKKVHSLTHHPAYYQQLLDRVNLYRAFIEKVLQEEGLPIDFLYLVIQESGLIPDRISGSQAVGFWQFKEPAGNEVGLRIDHHVDERMHIIASTRGFAQYIKGNYNCLQNWLYALLAHYLGRTGTKNFIAENKWHINNKYVIIDKNVHWYIYHFIAHKIAFESASNARLHTSLRLYEYHDCHGKSLHEISKYFNVPLSTVQEYNPWVKPLSIPTNVRYPLLIPMSHEQYARFHGRLEEIVANHRIQYQAHLESSGTFPAIQSIKVQDINQPTITLINGLKGILVKEKTSLVQLAATGHITLEQLLTYNEIDSLHEPIEGQVYYFEQKNRRGKAYYHAVQPQETWWTVAQKYGIRKASLLRRNRVVDPAAELIVGRILWIRFIRPANIPVAYVDKPSNTPATNPEALPQPVLNLPTLPQPSPSVSLPVLPEDTMPSSDKTSPTEKTADQPSAAPAIPTKEPDYTTAPTITVI